MLTPTERLHRIILAELSTLATGDLPDIMIYTEVNRRVWKAFDLGRKYQKEIASDEADEANLNNAAYRKGEIR